MKDFIIGRMKEPSTWAGLSVVATVLGAPPGTVDIVHQIVGGLFGLAAMFMPENKG